MNLPFQPNFSVGMRFNEFLRKKTRAERVAIAQKLRILNSDILMEENQISAIIDKIYQNVQQKFLPRTQEKFTDICNGLLEKLNQSSSGISFGSQIAPGISSSQPAPNNPISTNAQNRAITTIGDYPLNISEIQNPTIGTNPQTKRPSNDRIKSDTRTTQPNRDLPINLNITNPNKNLGEQTSQSMNLEKLKLKNMDKCYCLENTQQAINPNILKNDKNMIQCVTCYKNFHSECMMWPEEEMYNFECPRCIIQCNDPLNEVKKTLIEPSILVSDINYRISIETEDFQNIQNENLPIGIEIRCIKLDGLHFFEQTWPDKAAIKINGKTIKDIKPLHQNSSLKKRRDEKLYIKSQIRSANLNQQFFYQNCKDNKNSKSNSDPSYVFTVVLVQKLSTQELSDKIINNSFIDLDTSKSFIRDRFFSKNDIQISEVKADLICKITYTLINLPVRGKYCRHINCFSLNYFLLSMEHNAIRKWSCPLCKKRCSKLVYDTYFEQIIQAAKNYKQELEFVFFFKNGDYSFNNDINKTYLNETQKLQINEFANQSISSIKTSLMSKAHNPMNTYASQNFTTPGDNFNKNENERKQSESSSTLSYDKFVGVPTKKERNEDTSLNNKIQTNNIEALSITDSEEEQFNQEYAIFSKEITNPTPLQQNTNNEEEFQRSRSGTESCNRSMSPPDVNREMQFMDVTENKKLEENMNKFVNKMSSDSGVQNEAYENHANDPFVDLEKNISNENKVLNLEPESSDFNLYNENLTNCDLNFDEYNAKTPRKNSQQELQESQMNIKHLGDLGNFFKNNLLENCNQNSEIPINIPDEPLLNRNYSLDSNNLYNDDQLLCKRNSSEIYDHITNISILKDPDFNEDKAFLEEIWKNVESSTNQLNFDEISYEKQYKLFNNFNEFENFFAKITGLLKTFITNRSSENPLRYFFLSNILGQLFLKGIRRLLIN